MYMFRNDKMLFVQDYLPSLAKRKNKQMIDK